MNYWFHQIPKSTESTCSDVGGRRSSLSGLFVSSCSHRSTSSVPQVSRISFHLKWMKKNEGRASPWLPPNTTHLPEAPPTAQNVSLSFNRRFWEVRETAAVRFLPHLSPLSLQRWETRRFSVKETTWTEFRESILALLATEEFQQTSKSPCCRCQMDISALPAKEPEPDHEPGNGTKHRNYFGSDMNFK